MEARQFLSCIARLAQRRQRFGAAHVIDILRGARNERVLSRGHDTLSVYGIGRQRSTEEWRIVARALIHQGLVDESQDGYPVLSLNAQSGSVLREEIAVLITVPVKPRRPSDAARGPRTADTAGTGGNARAVADAAQAQVPESLALFDRLRALRKRLADEGGLPPYVVFHDATLREMVARRPLTLNQFAELPGVGQAKLARYGDQFVAALREYSAP